MQGISWLWSPSFLLNRRILWLLIVVNGLGTVYGYIWYGNQIEYTLTHMADWLLPFVPDSPTASLFFTLALIGLALYGREEVKSGWIRGFIEAFAVVTSIKYGIWAVWMIFMGASQGDAIVWQEWMLVGSHLGMAIEAMLFARFFGYRLAALVVVSVWTLLNDLLDYNQLIYPWLPDVLEDDLGWIEAFTITLSLLSIAAALVLNKIFGRSRV